MLTWKMCADTAESDPDIYYYIFQLKRSCCRSAFPAGRGRMNKVSAIRGAGHARTPRSTCGTARLRTTARGATGTTRS